MRYWLGSLSGSLLMKSMIMSRDVHEAMISRGFTGKVKTLKQFAFARVDFTSFLIILTIAGGAFALR